MDQQEQKGSDDFQKTMKDLEDEFKNGATNGSLESIKAVLVKFKAIVRDELSKGNINNATMIKEYLTKYVPIGETNKMMKNLEKLYEVK